MTEFILVTVIVLTGVLNLFMLLKSLKETRALKNRRTVYDRVCRAADYWDRTFDLKGAEAGKAHGESIRILRQAVGDMRNEEKEMTK